MPQRKFLFSSESVNEGHPDKVCDQVSDAVLDTCLATDPKSKVACETCTKDNMVMVAGEIPTQAKLDYEQVVRKAVQGIGYDSYVDDLSSVDSKGLSYKTCEVLVRINKQSPDIAGGVHVGKEEMDVGAGDQGIMFGYATDETADCMPLTHSMATRLGKTLTDVRKSGECWWLRPDGKTQVTIEYTQKADGSVEPTKIHTVVISTQHAEPLKATRKKEVEGYTGEDATAPSMEEMNKILIKKVVKRTLSEIKLKNGKEALTLYGDHTHNYINPSGPTFMPWVYLKLSPWASIVSTPGGSTDALRLTLQGSSLCPSTTSTHDLTLLNPVVSASVSPLHVLSTDAMDLSHKYASNR